MRIATAQTSAHPQSFTEPSFFARILYEQQHDIIKKKKKKKKKKKNGLCAQQWLRSAWAFAQSDQSLRCSHEETLGPQLPTVRTAKADKTRLGAQVICWFCRAVVYVNPLMP